LYSEEDEVQLIEKVVYINRVAKVVKAAGVQFQRYCGRGDGKGMVGFGLGKANEVPKRSAKGSKSEKRHETRPVIQDTIPMKLSASGEREACC